MTLWPSWMPSLTGRPGIGPKTGNPKPSASGKAHMALVAQCPCVICGAWPVTVHHCISGRYGQRKASDFETIPLCWSCHQGPHGIHANKRAWEAENGPDTGFLPLVQDLVAKKKDPSR